ncbi:MAG TPA: amidase [Solirubrobacteraceae bacterium]|nr:amidase [Solirubrobacteraceae bacterium]
MDISILELDGLGQAEKVRGGEIRASELAQLAITQIEALNPVLNCVVVERFQQALIEAQRIDAEPVGTGPFRGVPALLKDLGQQIEGLTQTNGSRAPLMGAPDRDSAIAASYRQAGMVLLGKTSAPEFGNHSTTEPAAHGPCRNPWDISRTTGGSSGGSGAAVAARMVAIAGASDGAGSIRIPASCCGVFGLKPSRGRITSSPYPGDSLFGLAIGHALTRSVRDSAALLDISSGSTPGDYWSAPNPARAFAEEVGAAPGPLRIAVSTKHLTGAGIHPECIAATTHAAELLTQLGHQVEEGEPTFEISAMTHSMLDLWATGNVAAQVEIAGTLERGLAADELEPTTWELIEHARGLTVTDLVRARGKLQAAAWRIAEFFERYDLWLTPTLAQPPLPLGELNRSLGTAASWWEYDLAFNPWNPVANIAGCPSASLPLHWSPDDLPIGSLLTAGYGREADLIRVCAQLEEAQPWADRAPAVVTRGGAGMARPVAGSPEQPA